MFIFWLLVGAVVGYIAAHYYYKDDNLTGYVLKEMSDKEVSKLVNELVTDKPVKKARKTAKKKVVKKNAKK